MFNINAKNVKEEHVEVAYKYVQEYCTENKLDVVDFVSNVDNIQPASEYIYKKLPLPLKLVLKPKKISELIINNHAFIIEKAKSYSSSTKA